MSKMARRKSLNKRLSRYGKYSIGSAVLDPDTETLDDEYPYWWKNVENNTIVRPSIDSNVLNQTSRHLDSDSQIETSEAEDEWWKVLEDSNTSKTLKMKMNTAKNAEKDAINNNTSMSESLEEVKIPRKRFTLRSKTKKSNDNAFLNVLNASTATITAELGQMDERKGSMYNSATNGVTVTTLRDKDETEENSQSQKSSVILKLKSKIFNKNYKNDNENVFTNILKENKLQNSSQEGRNDQLQAMTNTPGADSTRSDYSVLSSEDANDIPHVFVPKAQSTILGSTLSARDSSESNSNSDIDHRVFKRKSKLLTHYKGNMKRCLFEDLSKRKEFTNEVRESDLIRKNAATGGKTPEQSARSSRISEASGKNVREKREHARLLMKITNKLSESNVLANTSVTSSDASDLSRDLRRAPKTKTRFLTVPRKNLAQDQFKNLLEENDNIDESATVQSKDLSHLPEEENLVFDDIPSVQNKNDGVRGSDSRNNIESRNFNLSSSYTSSDSKHDSSQKQPSLCDTSEVFKVKDVEISRKGESENRKRNKSVSPVRVGDALEGSEKDISTRRSDRLSKSRNYSLRNTIEASEAKDVGNTLERGNRSRNKVSEETVSSITEQNRTMEARGISSRQSDRSGKSIKPTFRLVSSDSEADENKADSLRQSSRRQHSKREEVRDELEGSKEDISTRRSDRLSKSENYSLRNRMGASEVKDVGNTLERGNRSRNKVSEETVSSITEQNRTMEARGISSRQSDRSGKSIKPTFRLVSSDSEADENKAVSPRQSSRRQRSKREEVRDELEGSKEDIPTRRSDRLSKSKNYSLRNTIEASEAKDVGNTLERGNRSRNKVSEETVSSITEQNRTMEARGISSRQSDRSGKSIKPTFRLVSSDSEADENKAVSPRQSSRRQRSKREEVRDELEGSKEDIPTRRSDRLSKSKNYSLRNRMGASEVKDVGNTLERSNRSRSNVSEETVSSITEQNQTMEARDISTKQSDSTIQSGLSEPEESREEDEDDELNGAQRHSMSPAVEEMEEITSIEARKRSTLSSRDQLEPEEGENTAKRQKRSSNRTETRHSFSNDINKIGQYDTKRKSNRSNISEKQVMLSDSKMGAAGRQDENSTVQQKISKLRVSFLDESYVEKVRKGVNRESQSLSVPIKKSSATEMSNTRLTNFSLNDRRDGNDNNVNERDENKEVESEVQHDTDKSINRLTRFVTRKEQDVSESGNRASGKAANITPSTRARKILSSNISKGQKSIESFFDSVRRVPESGELEKKMSLEEVNKKLEKVKEWAMVRVNIRRNNDEGEARVFPRQKRAKEDGGKKVNLIAQRRPVAKQIHKAFLVNGQVYRVPRLPRPKAWITDRLYNYLWKRLEPKYKLQTRLVSEKFIIQLSDVTTLIDKRKLYDNYKAELHALMKEMARLNLICTRKDFYDFCHEFFPYELWVKIIPMILPGNKRNIPYNANRLHTPILADR